MFDIVKGSNVVEYDDTLYSRLSEYSINGKYPFHMPGHKRNSGAAPEINPYMIDITEIDGFDDLHHAKGCIAYAQNRAAEIYNSKRTYFLINGCTGGILAAVSACAAVGNGNKIILARNSHKSVYNAVLINRLVPLYVWQDDEGAISADDIDDVLKKNDDVSCVFITSPTYEGVVSDIKRIADTVHSYGKILIVDEAHGAHMRFADIFPESALEGGADIVIHGIHKTLPSLTQTALLHVNRDIADIEMLEKYLSVYQSSSPSYVLMGAIDYCMAYIERNAEKDFLVYEKNLKYIYDELKGLRNIYILPYSSKRDASKIVVCTERAGIDGKECYRLLRERYNIQPEMSDMWHVILMTSVCDSEKACKRLVDALKGIDEICSGKEGYAAGKISFGRCEMALTPYQALTADAEETDIALSAGKISAETVYVYPPGVPIVAAGEIITPEIIRILRKYPEMGYELYGIADNEGKKIRVCKVV